MATAKTKPYFQPLDAIRRVYTSITYSYYRYYRYYSLLPLFAGLGYEQLAPILPAEFDVACHNSSDNCTVSAPAEQMHKFVERLESEGVFVRTVNVANIAFHSRYIATAGPKFLVQLRKVSARLERVAYPMGKK